MIVDLTPRESIVLLEALARETMRLREAGLNSDLILLDAASDKIKSELAALLAETHKADPQKMNRYIQGQFKKIQELKEKKRQLELFDNSRE